jgi:hypothetical protein
MLSFTLKINPDIDDDFKQIVARCAVSAIRNYRTHNSAFTA